MVNLRLISSFSLLIMLDLAGYAGAESSTIPQAEKHPSIDAIHIQHVKLTHIDEAKQGERYEAHMEIYNSNPNWTAVEICVHVRFHDAKKKLIAAHQTNCLRNLDPSEQRQFVVTYAGLFPRYVSDVIADPHISSVKWTLKQTRRK